MEKLSPGLAIVGLLSAALATISSCSSPSGRGGASGSSSTSGEAPKHAIKILSSEDRTLFEVGPMPTKKLDPAVEQQLHSTRAPLPPLSAKLQAKLAQLTADRRSSLEAIGYVSERPSKAPGTKSAALPAAPGRSTLGTVGGPDKENDNLTETTVDLTKFGVDPVGGSLMSGAAFECGMGSVGNAASEQDRARYPEAQIMPQGSLTSPDIFTWGVNNCETTLHRQQMLTCMAGKLIEVANAVGPVTWQKVPHGVGDQPSGTPRGPWVLPPQQENDRFILRDQAIMLLAEVAHYEAMPPGWDAHTDNVLSCDALYALAPSLDEESFNELSGTLFGVPLNETLQFLEPTLPVTYENRAELSRSRMATHAAIFRGAGRLLRDELISKSVYADLSGAFAQRAHATDPARGPRLMWGIDDHFDQNPFNTIRHAAKTLTGRTELGSQLLPGSVSVAPIDALLQFPNLMDRVADLPIRTNGQSFATRMIETNGILLPESTPRAGLKDAILDHLLELEVDSNNIPAEDVANFKANSTLRAAMAGVSDDDLQFALARARNTYAQVTQRPVPAVFDENNLGGGLKAGATTNTLTGLGGVVVKGGLRRDELGIDVMARAGALMVTGQADAVCDSDFPTSGAVGRASLLFAGGAANGWDESRQDVFSTGYMLRRSLGALGYERQQAGFAETDPIVQASQTGVAELAAWAGPGKVVFKSVQTENPPYVSMAFTLTGFQLSDLGLNTGSATQMVSEVQSKLAIVYGEPWVADCAAGIRTQCPDDFAVNYIARPTDVVITTPDLAQGAALGTRAPLIDFNAEQSYAPNFLPVPDGFQGLDGNDTWVDSTGKHVYLVAQASPGKTNQGRVLAAMRVNGVWSSTIASEYRRELLNAAVGVPSETDTRSFDLGAASTSVTQGYCIEGVRRNFFVPLESELTENGDQFENSWRHYLERAKDTAARSDELANQLLQLKKEQAYQQQGAQEQLAQTCGQYADLSGLSFKDGEPVLPNDSADATLSQCLKEDTWDIVFLSTDQAPILCPNAEPNSDAETKCLKKAVFNCLEDDDGNITGDHPFCKRSGHLTHTGLALAQAKPDDVNADDSCAKMAGITQSITGGGFNPTELATLGDGTWREPAALQSVADYMQMKIEDNGEWEVYSQGTEVMDSRSTSELWPGCLNHTPACNPKGPSASLLIKTFDQIFRDPSDHTDETPDPAQMTHIMWRVEGAIWMLGGLAGSYHKGLFNVPFPAVNFPENQPDFYAPIPTVFGLGTYHSGPNFRPDTTSLKDSELANGIVDDDEVNAMPTGTSIDIGARFDFTDLYTAQPWLKNIYSGSNRSNYLHLRTDTIAQTHPAPPSLKKFLTDVGAGFKGTQCSQLMPVPAASQVAYPYGATNDKSKSLAAVQALKPGEKWVLCGQPGHGALTIKGDSENNTPVLHVFSPPTFEFEDEYSFSSQNVGSCSDEGTGCGDDLWLFSSPIMPHETLPTGAAMYAPMGMAKHASCVDAGFQSLLRSCDVNGIYQPETCGMVTPDEGGAPYYYCSAPGKYRLTRNRLRPSACPVANRAPMVTNVAPPLGACDAAAQLTQALAMACAVQAGGALESSTALQQPDVTSLDDLPKLKQWVTALNRNARVTLNSLYMDSVPKRAIPDAAQNASSQSLEGDRGAQIDALGQALRSISNNWSVAGDQLGLLASYIEQLQIDITAVNLKDEEKKNAIAIQRLTIIKDMVAATASLFSLKKMNPVSTIAAVASAGTAIGTGALQLKLLADQKAIATQEHDNDIRGAINKLHESSISAFGQLQRSLDEVKGSANTALQKAGAIASSQNSAVYDVAKAAGLPYVTTATGEKVDIPVNRVLREQTDIFRHRYEKTVNQAKYLAYFARLAIEQRIAMRLDDIDVSIGNLEAPSTWADDICSLKGIDYNNVDDFGITFDDEQLLFSWTPPESFRKGLSDASLDVAKGDRSEIFVGDYVNRLENFVSFYNIQYPSKDAADVAVLSMKNDLVVTPEKRCAVPAVNLLRYSSSLTSSAAVDATDGSSSTVGWESTACDTNGVCLQMLTGDSQGLGSPQASGAGTWLHDEQVGAPPTNSGGSAGGGGGAGGAAGPTGGAGTGNIANPPSFLARRAVFQRVPLQAGSYVLSWWDRPYYGSGREPQVNPPYRVNVVDPGGETLAAFSDGAQAVTGWGVRRSSSFQVSTPGVHYVVFGASPTADLGSVAIGNVQLEKVTSVAAPPSPYVETSASLTVLSNTCGSSSHFQDAFDYRCEFGQCYYDLKRPFVIDTAAIETGISPLSSKFAKGNFNFRDISIALNVVGTGVIDCSRSPNPDCNSNAYVNYTLQHIANRIPLFDYNNEAKYFDFGTGAINGAKALTAERLITQPIGSADQGLLGEPQFTKTELGGRPLTGTYRLRIYDQPGLVWEAIDDIQMVVNYRYWSRVQVGTR